MGFKNSKERKEYMKKYFKSEIGVLKKLYHHMKERSIKNNWFFDFSFEDFKIWTYDNDFKESYMWWVVNNYNKWEKPSIDRLNEYDSYNFNNMVIVTWEQNHIKMRTEKKNVDSYTKTFSKYRESMKYPVTCIKGDFHFVFKDLNEVVEYFPFMLKSKISNVVNCKRNHHHGFKFYKGVVAQ